MTGSIALTCAQRDGRSYLSKIRHDGLSRVSRPQRAGDAAHVVLSHLGPGVIGGDHYTLDARVEANASLLVTGQMATPVYAREGASSVNAAWHVANGAALFVRSEPVMLDNGARYDMHTSLDVAGEGLAIFSEIVTVSGEGLARSRCIVRVDGRVDARDACDLQDFSGVMATFIVACPITWHRKAIVNSLAPIVKRSYNVQAGVGGAKATIIIRAASKQVWELQTFISAMGSAACAAVAISKPAAVELLASPPGPSRLSA